MDSQIHENADGPPDIDRILAETDAGIAKLAEDRAALAERRRVLIAPRYKTVVAEPTEIHNKIALGGVLVNIGLSAIDADALATCRGICRAATPPTGWKRMART